MNKLFLIFTTLLSSFALFGQMDNKFYYPNKEWNEISYPFYEDFFLNRGDDSIHSVIFKPESLAKGTVLFFHGNGGNISQWESYLLPLVLDGFQVCILDYRGYGKSSGMPTHLNIAEDCQIWFDSLTKREDIINSPIIIYGASIGTQIAAKLAKDNNQRISALVLDGMMASFTDIALHTSPPQYHEQIRTYVTSPYSAKEDIREIKNISLLFIHSEEDHIPIKDALEVYKTTTCKKTFWKYEGKHVEAPLKHPETLVKHVNSLLD